MELGGVVAEQVPGDDQDGSTDREPRAHDPASRRCWKCGTRTFPKYRSSTPPHPPAAVVHQKPAGCRARVPAASTRSPDSTTAPVPSGQSVAAYRRSHEVIPPDYQPPPTGTPSSRHLQRHLRPAATRTGARTASAIRQRPSAPMSAPTGCVWPAAAGSWWPVRGLAPGRWWCDRRRAGRRSRRWSRPPAGACAAPRAPASSFGRNGGRRPVRPPARPAGCRRGGCHPLSQSRGGADTNRSTPAGRPTSGMRAVSPAGSARGPARGRPAIRRRSARRTGRSPVRCRSAPRRP